MPTWPILPLPYSVSPFGVIDPAHIAQVDQGYSLRRSKYSRSRRLYQIVYLDTADNIQILTDFIERVTRVNALAFDWTFPYAQTITTISTGNPNILTTVNTHGLQTRQQVVVANTATHNGTFTITRIDATSFALDGTSGGGGESIGDVAFHAQTGVCVFPGDRMPIPEQQHAFGPLRDAEGLFTFTVPIEVVFA